MNTSLDRASILDKKFTSRLLAMDFPIAKSTTSPQEAGLSKEDCLELFETQIISRHLDFAARKLREQNLSFYTIGSSGHEGNAAIAKVFRVSDMGFLHYRSLAFMLQRALKAGESREKAIKDHLLALVASKEDPIAGGRHKVFGSLKLFVPPQTSTIASHLPKALGTAFSVHLAKELSLNTPLPQDSVVLASFGDASINHSTALGAFNAATWVVNQGIPLPIVFICEDNGIGVSVPTPKDWIEKKFKLNSLLHYILCDGLNFCDVFLRSKQAEQMARVQKKPVFLHFKTVRLLGHAGSDIETHYHTYEEINAIEAEDPLLHSASLLIDNHFATSEEILASYERIRQEIQKLSDEVIKAPKLSNASEIMSCIIPPKRTLHPNSAVQPSADNTNTEFKQNNKDRVVDQLETDKIDNEPKHMAVLLNQVLAETLANFPNTLLFGEDVGKKGGVYRITAGLQQQFGKRRVFDTLLDEQTILGTALGLAHNGFIPIPEIQFMAFLHNAEDQIRGEASTLSFFSQGQFTNPMILRLPGLAYQKGFGGHFHNDNAFAFLREIPGIIIACPSNGGDAVKIFRRCLQLAMEEQRVVIFLEPIALYMTKDLYQPNDKAWLNVYPDPKAQIAFGELGVYGNGQDIIILSYGNGYYLSRQAEKILREEKNIQTTLVDIRWLAPLNIPAIIELVKPFKRILIVDEGRKTGSLSEELITALVEHLSPLSAQYSQHPPNSEPSLNPLNSLSPSGSSTLPTLTTLPLIRRITGLDCFIPLGDAWQLILPSKEAIINMACDMMKL
jgi:2-oxoisovalerate dehydrogenase E1 component